MSPRTKTPEKTDESAEAGTPTRVLPCLGACKEDTKHDLEGKMAICSICDHMRSPAVGAGSPAGARWFVTKFPAWSTTMTPEDWIVDAGRTVKVKPQRLVFKKILKPRRLVSTQGVLGTENTDGGDMNASRWLGVFSIVDPGAEPKTKNEVLARSIVDFLRGHEYYRKTLQDNRLPPNPELLELSWDPTLKKPATGVSVSRRVSLDQHDEETPLDERPEPTRAKVGVTRRPAPRETVSASLPEGE